VRLVEELAAEARVEGFRLVLSPRGEALLDAVRDALVEEAAGEGLEVALRWVGVFLGELDRAAAAIGARGWSFPRELKSFLEDPRMHLRKKLFNYAFDLARGRIGPGEFLRKGEAAVRTSLKTNMRSIYQDWVFAALLTLLGEGWGARLVYPETRVVALERTGKQRAGSIPPNAVVSLPRGELSFFLEAPRPLGWEDPRDLERTWRLYVAPRPDVLVYSGMVLDIARPDSDPPVERPDVIIECKEQGDWFTRVRDLRGPGSAPMRASEWRARWLRGLEEGLADVLGVDRGSLRDFASGRSRSLRVPEHRLLLLYREVYRPRRLYLVSRARLPGGLRGELESEGVIVVDGVEIGDRGGLEGLAGELAGIARPSEAGGLEAVALAALRRALAGGLDPVEEVGRAVLERLAAMGFEEAGGALRGRASS